MSNSEKGELVLSLGALVLNIIEAGPFWMVCDFITS